MVKIAIPNFCINFLNKTVKSLSILCDFAVAPFTGAWIKIKESSWYSAKIKSHPSRVRGLKYLQNDSFWTQNQVAPFTGAWIKIIQALPC